MSENKQLSMFFIRSPDAKLSAIETFLKKRDYHVTVESDIKEALVKMIEQPPDYVFLAFDHPNSKITNLPTIIDQSLLTTIVAFVHSNTKEAMRKINFSGYKHKLYPPLSGPAIERLVLKIEKERQAGMAEKPNEEAEKRQALTDKSGDMVQVKSNAIEKLNNDVNGPESENQATPRYSPERVLSPEQKKSRTRSIKTKRALFSNFPKRPLQQEQKSKLKKFFENEIMSDLKDIESTMESETSDLVYFPEQPKVNPSGENLPSVESLSGPGNEILFMEQSSARKKTAPTNETEDSQQIAKGLGGIHLVSPARSLCLVVESETWTGFVIGMSTGPMEAQLIGPLLVKWINSIYPEAIDNENYDYFNVAVDQVKLGEYARAASDHYEVSEFKNKSIMMATFSIEPSDLTFNVVDEHDFIEVPIELIPEDKPLELNLNLYLPENNKYLLYTRLGQSLTSQQKSRLQDKKVTSLYTPVDNEELVKQFRINELVQTLLAKFSKELLK